MDIGLIVEKLKRIDGVVQVEILDQENMLDLRKEENNIILSSGMRYEDRALLECCKKDVILCLFCDGFLEESDDITMIMSDNLGNILGNDVPACRMKEYSERKDVIWISDNFVVYPQVQSWSDPAIVILPRKFRFLDSEKDVKDAISFYPSVSSDIMLKEHFVVNTSPRMTTLIVGFDICN